MLTLRGRLEKAVKEWRDMPGFMSSNTGTIVEALERMLGETEVKEKEVTVPDDANEYNLLEMGWGIIANSFGGDWDLATPEWRRAAERWRNEYHKTEVPEAKGPAGVVAKKATINVALPSTDE